MSESELIARNPNIIQTTATERTDYSNPHIGVALYKSDYKAMEIDFTAYYTFNANKLVKVSIKPVDLANWPKVNLAMGQIYGQPMEDKSHKIGVTCNVIDRTWRSEKEKNLVSAF